ncbi:hypothetical protein RRG08_014618 [Elysia crispata]|uniref:Uncharacterized protein n=1 Tax=Elysia crispata TaxID=231223 RepID=A0AAE1D3X3_9GAST|nr:hypothetical protein RRG08_014618 [Elysia crispata]
MGEVAPLCSLTVAGYITLAGICTLRGHITSGCWYFRMEDEVREGGNSTISFAKFQPHWGHILNKEGKTFSDSEAFTSLHEGTGLKPTRRISASFTACALTVKPSPLRWPEVDQHGESAMTHWPHQYFNRRHIGGLVTSLEA